MSSICLSFICNLVTFVIYREEFCKDMCRKMASHTKHDDFKLQQRINYSLFILICGKEVYILLSAAV